MAKKTNLKEYARKRDLKASGEPAAKVKDTGLNRFVVQEHHSSRLHYDFRLEMDGVLKSWAVPKGVPLEHGVKRLAVNVEDHAVDYMDFEGTIPDGNYGAGEVIKWDSGTYTLDEYREGKTIAVTLSGSKLNGRYVLVHTKGKNWILFKRSEGTGEK